MRFKTPIKEILAKTYPGCETVQDALAYIRARIANKEPLPPINEISNQALWADYRMKHGASPTLTTPEAQKPPISDPKERRKLSLPYKDDDEAPDIPF
jgi:hypothetical protein